MLRTTTLIRGKSSKLGCMPTHRDRSATTRHFLEVAAVLALVSLLGCALFAEKAYATQPLTVYVGYSGGPYYTKHTYSTEELESLADPFYYAYSAIDKKPSLVKYVAWGVPLEKIYANSIDPVVGTSVNQSALWRIAFDTDDDYKPDNGVYGNDRWYWNYYNNYETGSVLNPAKSPRYYYSAFDRCFDFSTQEIISSKSDELVASGSLVPTILALKYVKERVKTEEEWNRLDNLASGSVPGSLETSGTVDARNRLLFGQTMPREQEVENEVHSVTGLYCIYQGRPKVTLDTSQINGSIGDTVQVRATIDAVDDLIVREGPGDVTWTSEDENVATVVGNGDGTASVTIHGKGDVKITASFGKSSSSEFQTESSLNVSGPGGSGWREEGEGDGWDYGDGDGEKGPGAGGKGDGTGEQEGDGGDAGGNGGGASDGGSSGEGAGSSSGTSENSLISPLSYAEIPQGATSITLISKSLDGTTDVNESGGSPASGSGVIAEEVAAEDSQLYRVETESQEMEQQLLSNVQVPWGMLLSFLLLMAVSAISQILYFRHSLDRPRRGKSEPNQQAGRHPPNASPEPVTNQS